MLYATVRQRKIHVKNPVTVIRNGIGVDRLTLDMDEEWKTMDSIVCVFLLKYMTTETVTEDGDEKEISVAKEISKEMLYTFGEEVQVPWECITETGKLSVSCTGYVGEEKVMTTMLPDSFWDVVQNGPLTGDVPMEPTPTLYEQVLAAAGAANSAAASANAIGTQLLTDKENGAFDGVSPTVEVGTVTTGVPGSDAQVTNSGTPTAAVFNFTIPMGKTGPQGSPGKDGYTPQRGVDYLTEEEVGHLQTHDVEYIKRMPYRYNAEGTAPEFGIAIHGSAQKLMDAVNAKQGENDLGFYTCYVSADCPDAPISVTGSSFRGFVHITNNAFYGDKLYAYILLVDDHGDIFIRYIKGGAAGEWKKHYSSAWTSTGSFVPNAWTHGQYITGGTWYGTNVKASQFQGWDKLVNIEFADPVVIVNTMAFFGCTALTLESLPESLTNLGTWAFTNCKAIPGLTIHNKLVSLGSNAFQGCTAMETLTVHANAKLKIYDNAFTNCTGLKEITFTGKPTSIAKNAFSSCTNVENIYVPWAEGEVAGAPWGAAFAAVHYGHTEVTP